MSTNAPSASKVIPVLKSRFYHPVKRIIAQLGEAFERDGDVVQVTGFPIKLFCFRNPEHIAKILTHAPVGETKYSKILPRVQWVMRSGAYILSGGPPWRERRHLVQAAFRRQCLMEYAAQVPALTRHMLERWNALAESGESFDAYRELRLLITQTSFKTLFSEDLSGDALDEIQEHTHFIESSFIEIPPLWLPLPRQLRFRRSTHRLREVMRALIRRRRAHSQQRQDLLSVLLELKHSESGLAWSDDEMIDEMFSVYFGASVMATTLAWGLHLMATHPVVQEKMIQEGREVLQGRDPVVEDLPQLNYCHWVLQEILRLYPPSWGYPRHCVQGMELDGYQIPPKSMVIPMVYHTQRDPRLWPDPERFDPERFDPQRASKITPYAAFPFGGGARMCLGANFAPLVMRLILTMIFQRYRLEFRPRFAADPVAEFGFEIHPQDQIPMRVQRLGS